MRRAREEDGPSFAKTLVPRNRRVFEKRQATGRRLCYMCVCAHPLRTARQNVSAWLADLKGGGGQRRPRAVEEKCCDFLTSGQQCPKFLIWQTVRYAEPKRKMLHRDNKSGLVKRRAKHTDRRGLYLYRTSLDHFGTVQSFQPQNDYLVIRPKLKNRHGQSPNRVDIQVYIYPNGWKERVGEEKKYYLEKGEVGSRPVQIYIYIDRSIDIDQWG